ncbi:hydroxymethylglutaryl-CoA lyase, mitochondrial [Diachasma alloeum]|uniref:hydroxymethylglutaryl-CoA lyase, mitochondrial n=1 Tax=Diachasma alloeum TaxID=454923 RepID=UPI0007383733|nr:hydroxymethylglutaryl-CoA lyase, mitochondrial [Diachasma alloeum]
MFFASLRPVLPTRIIFTPRRFSDFVRIVEVGPRDGLQNEKTLLPASTKIAFINKLSHTGLKTIEATSFVSPKWIPQMQDSSEVFSSITKAPGVSYPVLVPNLKGLDSAIASGAKEIAVFGAVSETFTMRNINCSIAESIKRLGEVIKKSLEHGIRVRGYVSCIAGCPYEGNTKPSMVARVSASMLEAGCYEISLGDTIGVGTPRTIVNVLNEVKSASSSGDLTQFALHCHNTYGQALANIFAGLDLGVRVFDSSVGGLGGCPYAPGASGNVPTEDLLYLLHGEGLETGVDLEKIMEIGVWISKELGRENQSKVGVALASRKRTERSSG